MRLAALIAVIGLQAYGALVTVSVIGKPRRPVTPGIAIATLIVSVLMCAGVYYLYAS